jgi:hypothetical protein
VVPQYFYLIQSLQQTKEQSQQKYNARSNKRIFIMYAFSFVPLLMVHIAIPAAAWNIHGQL